LSLEGVLADAENVEVFYLKETISFNEIQEKESKVWETAILYKFYVKLDKPCNLFIYLPFSLQGSIEWKQENMRSENYQTEVAHAKRFKPKGSDIFHIEFFEELGEFTALLPPDRKLEDMTVITTKRIERRISSKITINISDLDLPQDFFKTNKCGFGFMLKVVTRDFLTRQNMEKLSKPGQIWSFNVKIYPVTSSLKEEEREHLINLHDTDIWVILPEDAVIFHLNPSPRVVMLMEKEDEDLENSHAGITGPYKTYKAGQIAVCWDLKNITKEIIMHYVGQSSSGVEVDIGGIRRDVERISNSVEELRETLNVSFEKVEKMQDILHPLDKDFPSFKDKVEKMQDILHPLDKDFHQFKEKTITWDQLFAPLTLFLTFFTLIMAFTFNIFVSLPREEGIFGNESFLFSLIFLVITIAMFLYFVKIEKKKSQS
jgi:hypothetical protein